MLVRSLIRVISCAVWVGAGGVPDADKISARPRKWTTSNAALATSGPREQEEARLLSKDSCSSAVNADDPAVR